MELWSNVFAETIAGLLGIFVGTLAALAVDRYKEQLKNRRRARTVLRSITQELNENHKTLQAVKPAYQKTSFGKSFYISTIAWETAMASGDLPAIIGYELTETISAQYAHLVRIRYHVDLLTQLWFAPTEIDGYEAIRRGFGQAIIETMHRAIGSHPQVVGRIGRALKE